MEINRHVCFKSSSSMRLAPQSSN